MLGALVALAVVGQERTFVHSSTSEYKTYEMSGFTVLASPAAVSDRKACDQALGLLSNKLVEIKRILPHAAYEKLKGVKIWVERDNPDNLGAVYHPSKEWLKQHGYNTDKEKCVELGNIRNFVSWSQTTQPLMVLHELAHAYHHQVLGYDDKDVKARFDAAVASGAYDNVMFVSGGTKKAYALTNEKEFFAEVSESYFGCNDFYPFDRRQLASFDKPTYEMLVAAWGLPAGEARELGSSATDEVLRSLGRSRN
jgi:hypothetical protein